MRDALRILLPVLLLCLHAPLIHAAEGMSTFPPGSNLRFRRIGIEDGLSQSSVQSVVQDARGYMWLGTQDGLQRYDGYNFITYRHDPANPGSLAENDVHALAVGDGALWVGTLGSGLDRLEFGGDRFGHFQHAAGKPASLADDNVNALCIDHNGRLWVGTAQGLDRMERDGSFTHFRVPSGRPNANDVLVIYEGRAGRLWVGTAQGLYYLDPRTQDLQAFVPAGASQAVQAVFTEAPVQALLETADRHLYVGGDRGLALLDAAGRVQAYFRHMALTPDPLPDDNVQALLDDPSGEVWVGTYTAGLARYDPQSHRFSSYRHDDTDAGSLSDDVVENLYRDHTGLLWIGTKTAGADIYNPETRAFGYYRHRQGEANSLAGNIVWSMSEDARGEVWVGSDQGLTRLDLARRRYTQYELGDRPANHHGDSLVTMVYTDRQGRLWAGADYGLYRYVPERNVFMHYDLLRPGGDPNGDVVESIFEDSDGRFWVPTAAGLVLFDRKSGAVRRFEHDPARADSLPDGKVLQVCETPGKVLWVATANGLGRFDGMHDHFTAYRADLNDDTSISDSDVIACYTDASGDLWLGTGSGLNHMDVDTGKFKRYSVADGLPNNNIYTVLGDAAGGIWVSTDYGLSRLDPTAGSFRNYGVSDGLQSTEFNGGSAYAAPDGELFFGGINGMNSFHPDRLLHGVSAPSVGITRVTAIGVELPLLRDHQPVADVQLEYHQNILSFEFAVFDYVAPSMNSFTYKLEGFDSVWHTVHGRHIATYTNLDPGEYSLHVRGANNDGVWTTVDSVLHITVLPPPWRTWWAYLLYAAAIFVVTMLASTLFKRSIKREHDLENEHQKRQWAEALHNLIQSVTSLRDERAIGEQLIDALTSFVRYERALFYVDRDLYLSLIASRGITPEERDYFEQWPARHGSIITRLRMNKQPQLLSSEDAATLIPGGEGRAQGHYLAVPMLSNNGGFRLLVVGQPTRSIAKQEVDIAAAMAKQVSVALDNAQLIKELENLATTDGLTRLYNRRHFVERAETEFERSQRYRRELSVLLMDADHFKVINDNYGHEMGDRVLRILAGTCRASLRQLDVIGRYGGEEFVVLLPETSAALAHETAERLREAVERLCIPGQPGDIRITVSIGIATAGPTTESVAALINEADRALYAAKRGGRNRVASATKDMQRV